MNNNQIFSAGQKDIIKKNMSSYQFRSLRGRKGVAIK